MKENLFRGQTNDGRWVEGYYVKAKYHYHKFGIHEDYIITGIQGNGGWLTVLGRNAVKPETVGQYTGVTDRNGKKIFEGDIVKTKTDICVIVWQGLGFIAKKPNKRPMCWQYVMCGGEIIGNIYDTPELISQPE